MLIDHSPEFAKPIAVLERLIGESGGRGNLAWAWYLLALGVERGRQGDPAAQGKYRDALQHIVTESADSPLFAEAALRLGDSFFDCGEAGSLEKAVEAYTRVLDAPGDRFRELALYHLAFAQARLGNWDRAIGVVSEFKRFAERSPKAELASRGYVLPELEALSNRCRASKAIALEKSR